jgi:hypothetical protein
MITLKIELHTEEDHFPLDPFVALLRTMAEELVAVGVDYQGQLPPMPYDNEYESDTAWGTLNINEAND